MKYPQFLIASFFILLSINLSAQRFGYPSVQERQLIGTKWRYAYTLHLESNTTVLGQLDNQIFAR